jgi:hypothetical protein
MKETEMKIIIILILDDTDVKVVLNKKKRGIYNYTINPDEPGPIDTLRIDFDI